MNAQVKVTVELLDDKDEPIEGRKISYNREFAHTSNAREWERQMCNIIANIFSMWE